MAQRVSIVDKHAPWLFYKDISASQGALGDDEKKATNIPSDAYKVPELIGNLELRISASGDSIDGKTGTVRVYGARIDDDIAHVGSVALTVGKQIATSGKSYVDTMVLTDRWITEVKVADGDGNDGMSRIIFDVSGYDVVFVRIQFGDTIAWRVEVSGFSR